LVPAFLGARVRPYFAVKRDVVIRGEPGVELEQHDVGREGVGVLVIDLPDEASGPAAVGPVEDVLAGGVPSQLPGFRPVKAHDGTIVLTVGEPHHARLILVRAYLIGVGEA